MYMFNPTRVNTYTYRNFLRCPLLYTDRIVLMKYTVEALSCQEYSCDAERPLLGFLQLVLTELTIKPPPVSGSDPVY